MRFNYALPVLLIGASTLLNVDSTSSAIRQQLCDYSNVWIIDNGLGILSVGLDCEGIDGKAVAQIEANTQGWVGIGFNTNCSMLGADWFAGWINGDGETVVLDMYGSSEEGVPVVDGTQNIGIFDVWESPSAGIGMLLITQPDQEDPMDFLPVFPEEPLVILWAYGRSVPTGDVLSEEDYHESRSGCVEFNFI